MGKPKSRVSRVSSDASTNLTSNMVNKKRKTRGKIILQNRRSIERLYNKLRANSSNDSPQRKRGQFTEDSVIYISDCNPVTSTPKNSRNTSQVNLTNFWNNTDNNISDLTKDINKSSYLTIDLTTETTQNSTCEEPTVIDLLDAKESPDADCIDLTPTSSDVTVTRFEAARMRKRGRDQQDLASSIESGECTIVLPDDNCSQASVVIKNPGKRRRKQQARENRMREFLDGVSKMNASDKGRFIDLICEAMKSSCQAPSRLEGVPNIKITQSRAVDTAEDTFIKEVILGKKASRNSVGSNIYNPEREIKTKSGLRMVVVDGSNVAMSHGQHKEFSVKGLKICLDYFVNRGHIVKAFVPRFRCKWRKSTDPRLLDHLERQGLVVYTPSREVQGRNITCYDDRYIVQCAAEFDGVIVSGDNYRDLLDENPRWRAVIETRLLQFTWVDDMIMFPEDPLGRNGPTLRQFLRHSPL